MDDIKITKDCYLCRNMVKYYAAYNSNFVKMYVRRARKEGKVFDLTCGKKILTVLFLTNGELILVPTGLDTIHARFAGGEKA